MVLDKLKEIAKLEHITVNSNSKIPDDRAREILANHFNNYTFENRNDALLFFWFFDIIDENPFEEKILNGNYVNLQRAATVGIRDRYKLKAELNDLTITIEDKGSKLFSRDILTGEWHEGYNENNSKYFDEMPCLGDTLEEAIKSLHVNELKMNWNYKPTDKIGLLTARTGYGKTTYIISDFVDEVNEISFVWGGLQPNYKKFTMKDILFITTRKVILEQEKKDKHVVDAYDSDFSKIGTLLEDREEKPRIITTHKLGQLYRDGKIEKMFPIIAIDEAHSLFLDATFADNCYECINCLQHFWKDIIKVGLTATPELILRYIDPEHKMFYILESTDLPARQNTTNFYYCNYTYLDSLLDKIKPTADSKVVVYSYSAKKAVELARKFNGKFLIANDQEKYPDWYEEQQPLRDYVIKNEKLPDDVNLVFMTSAYREGFELKDKKIKMIIIDACDEITISQFIGRVREDVETVIVNTNENQLQRYKTTIEEYMKLKECKDRETYISYYEEQMKNIQNKENQTLFIIKEGDNYILNPWIEPVYKYYIDCYYQATNKLNNQVIKYGNRDLSDSETWFNTILKDYSKNPIKNLNGKQEINDEFANWGAIFKYLNKRLYAEEKTQLATEIGLYDYAHNRIVKQSRLKELIRNHGFKLEEKRDACDKRYWYITTD